VATGKRDEALQGAVRGPLLGVGPITPQSGHSSDAS